MSTERALQSGRLSAQQVARFTTITALLAIFADGAVRHGLTYENAPF